MCMTYQVSALTRVVNVSELEGELTQALRNQVQGLTYNDTIVIFFDKIGSDTICGTITARCNVVMSGLGRCKSSVVLDNGTDKPGFIAFKDDTFFALIGTLENNISVTIKDMSFKLMDHSGIWWETSPKYAVKIYHANRVIIDNVNSYLKNAVCTNFDLRVCSNITVRNCDITNYNNCIAGGNLWIRGEMHNVSVTGNRFYKYGNDEALGIFGRLINANTDTKGNVTRSNIRITDNDFIYGYQGEDKNFLFNDMQFSLISGDPLPYTCTTNGFLFSNNRFEINDLTHRAMYVAFNQMDSYNDVQFNNNSFIDNYIGSVTRYYRNEVEVNDLSSDPDTVFFNENIFINKNPVVNPTGDSGAAFFLLSGGKVCLDGNLFQNTVTTDTAANVDIGVALVWCGEQGGEISLRNNMTQNLKQLARISAGNGIQKFKITANNNTFHGDTRLYCNVIDTLDLVFNKNLFISNDMNFFLQEFASIGSLEFNYNNVYVKTSGGKLMTHWTSAPTSSMHFTDLTVKNNLFRGVNSIDNLLIKITNVGNRTVEGNLCIQN